MAKSASSSRLRKTWENVKERHARDEGRFAWKAPSISKPHDPHQAHHHHDHGHHHHHHGHGHGMHHSHSAPFHHFEIGEVDEEEGALLIMEQKRKYRAAGKGLRAKYDELEDTVFDSRRPPLLRTTGGEVVQGIYPSRSHQWLGVQPRFGSTVPQEKYVGAFATDLSKWISADKMTRLKSEASIYDQPVRAYLKIDDSIDVAKMTGSHFRYIDNPLDEDLQEQKAKKKREALMNEQMALEDGSDQYSGSDQPSEQEPSEEPSEETVEDESEEEWDPMAEYETDSESLPSNVSGSEDGYRGSVTSSANRRDRIARRKERDARALAMLDTIFEKHIKKLSGGLQEEMQTQIKRVEGDWRSGQATRPATLRFRR